MKAIIETGGKQYYVSEGDIIYVEKLDTPEGKTVVFEIFENLSFLSILATKLSGPYRLYNKIWRLGTFVGTSVNCW